MVANIPPIEDANAAGPAVPPEPPAPDMVRPAGEVVTPNAALDPALSPSDTTPASESEDETPEQFMRRLVEENSWRIKPRPPRPVPPPEPKSIHLMTPEEMHESLPVHLRRRRPDGSYYAMGLISRMQTDLEELTQGKRAATYPEVDEYLGYALLAEGLAPRGLSAPEAVKWWRAGGSEVLSERADSSIVRASAGGENAVPLGEGIGQAVSGRNASPSHPQSDPDIVVAADPQEVAGIRSMTDQEFTGHRQMEGWLESLPDRPTSRKSELGVLSTRYEAGGRGPGTISTGRGDKGGPSYGSYQLASRTGTLKAFLASPEFASWAADFTDLTPGKPEFNKQWRAMAARDRDAFQKAQHLFIQRTHYEPAVAAVRKELKLDLDSRSDAVRNSVWSVAVQHGRAATILSHAVRDTDRTMAKTDPGYDQALIDNIYGRRIAYVASYRNDVIAKAAKLEHSQNPTDKRKRVKLIKEAENLLSVIKNRYPSERAEAQQMLIDEKRGAP